MKDEYTVWVGGVEVNDSYLYKEDALKLAQLYTNDGYTDVYIKKVKLKGEKNVL